MTQSTLWYKDAVLYQLRIASFHDSNGDGIGDMRGLVQKLDYLQDLGVTAIWLLPFYPSPLRDDGYDIADYGAVHPAYGSLRDLRTVLREAHRRGLRVVTELVLNHTSDQHPWFQRARRAAPGSRWRNFYVWNDSPQRYEDARIIFKDFESSNWAWDPVARSYYWHRFYSHQPDLNFENPEVRRMMLQVVDHWLEMGIDGMRLDAVPYLFEREGTSCENLPETHEFLKELRSHVDARFQDRMLLAEANQWPEDAVAYFGKGDECHMAFHFPIMPRLFMAIHTEDRYPILDIVDQTPSIPENCQWALFLRNHDELTLEMVTDEERDYLWRVYARDPRARINLGIRRRLAPLLGNNRRRIELMNALLFSLPGTPVVYYGDEIGMGDNVYLGDRNGVRTPMQWSPGRNGGFSQSNPQRLFLPLIVDPEYHYEAVNVETQQGNPSSLLWWTKRILALRREFHAFGRGSLEFLTPSNRKVLAFVRRHEAEQLLVVANLSRFSQYVELDLAGFEGCVPVELFGAIDFPEVGEKPYLLTLGPHAFYWFSLERRQPTEVRVAAGEPVPRLEAGDSWLELLSERGRAPLERVLPAYLRTRRWFRGKARAVQHARVTDVLDLGIGVDGPRLALVDVDYRDGDAECYALLLGFEPGATPTERPLANVALRGGAEGALVESSGDPRVAQALLAAVSGRRRLRSGSLELRGVPSRGFRSLRGAEGAALTPRALGAEQSNTSWLLGDRLVAKLFRRVESGESVELEVSRFLTERARFPHVPALAGHLELRRGPGEPCTLAVFQACVANEGDAWRFTLDEISRALEELRSQAAAAEGGEPTPEEEIAPFGHYLELARLLGRRTAELHTALAGDADDPAFAPEPFTPFARRSLYQSLRNTKARALQALRGGLASLEEPARELAEQVLASEGEISARLGGLLSAGAAGRRIRCHGDYHLGQVLFTGKDFVVIDLEGEPGRTLGERRLKRSPLADVAGMLRSFAYAVENVLGGHVEGTTLRAEDMPGLARWGRRWYESVSASFLAEYFDRIEPAGLLPPQPTERDRLLEVLVLEKALYELAYELNNRPHWVRIPLRGVLDVLAQAARREAPPR